MQIPKGYKLVKVTSSGVQFGNAWYSHESITGYSADQLNQGTCRVTGGAYMKWLSEETPPQPIYDEWKERELFEANYRVEFEENTGNELSSEDIKSMRDGPWYGESRHYLNGQWAGWKACAQSRAKAVEVGHE